MNHVLVKPHPDLDPAAWPLIVHPASGSLLDAAGNVPDDGRPWLNDGFTARMLTDAAVLRADDAAFAALAMEVNMDDVAKAELQPGAAAQAKPAPGPAVKMAPTTGASPSAPVPLPGSDDAPAR